MTTDPPIRFDDAPGASAREPLLSIRSGRDGATFVIALSGELDVSNADQVSSSLARAEASSVEEIVIDLSALRFIDSTGIALLHRAHVRSSANGGRLKVLRGPERVHRVIEVCGLGGILPFVD